MAVKHYLDALKIQVTARNMGAIFGGRAPHYQSIVVGGITQLPDADLIIKFKTMLEEVTAFIKNVYMKDVLLFGTGPLLPLAQAGIGGGHLNYLAYGAFPEDSTGKALFLKPGVIRNGNLGKVEPFDQKLKQNPSNTPGINPTSLSNHPMADQSSIWAKKTPTSS